MDTWFTKSYFRNYKCKLSFEVLIFKEVLDPHIYSWQMTLVLFFDIKHLFLIRILPFSHFHNPKILKPSWSQKLAIYSERSGSSFRTRVLAPVKCLGLLFVFILVTSQCLLKLLDGCGVVELFHPGSALAFQHHFFLSENRPYYPPKHPERVGRSAAG